MTGPRFTEGQTVKILPLTGADAAADRRLLPYAGRTGTVDKIWCLTRDEMPELSKMFVYSDVWCCDVVLDGTGETVPGIPDVALAACFPKRR